MKKEHMLSFSLLKSYVGTVFPLLHLTDPQEREGVDSLQGKLAQLFSANVHYDPTGGLADFPSAVHLHSWAQILL